MLIAQSLAEYGATAALMDGFTAARVMLEERFHEVGPLGWGVVVLGAAAVWLMFIRR